MFVKKDLRKIDEILVDDEDERTSLKLSKRSSEFKGNVGIICRESKIKALSNLRFLNLYENSLTSLQGIGILSQTPLEEINLGCNKLTSIPLEVAVICNFYIDTVSCHCLLAFANRRIRNLTLSLSSQMHSIFQVHHSSSPIFCTIPVRILETLENTLA